MKKDVSLAVSKNLCLKCGTCVGICPTNSITIKSEKNPIPVINYETCIHCGKCYEYCPGVRVDFKKMQKELFKSEYNSDVGFYKKSFIFQDKKSINSSSGGFVNALVNYLLKNNIVDYVIAAGSDKNSITGSVKIITKPSQTASLKGSKYHFIPVNSALKFVRENDAKFAFVSLPCQTHALRKLQLSDKLFQERIKLIIGLFCGTNKNYNATNYLLRKVGADEKDVKSVLYRSGGWEGNFTVKLKNGSVNKLSPNEWVFFHMLFCDYRCAYCIDLMNNLADISVGDAWFKDLKCKECNKYSCRHNRKGYSFVLVRNDYKWMRGFLKNKKFIVVNKEKIDDGFQKKMRNLKKNAFYRMTLSNNHPVYDFSIRSGNASKFYESVFLRTRLLFSNDAFLKIFQILPLKFARVLNSQLFSGKIL